MPPSRLPVRRAPVRLIIAVSLAVLVLIALAARDAADGLPPSATRLTAEHPPQPPVTPSTVPAPPPSGISALDAALARVADEARWVAAAPPPAAPSSGTVEASLVDEPSPMATVDASPSAEPAGSGDALGAIAAHFGDVYDSAVRVADCESSLDPGAVSPGGGNWGLFQINTVHRADFEAFTGRPWSAVLEADANAAYARKLYDGHGGWGPWECRWAA